MVPVYQCRKNCKKIPKTFIALAIFSFIRSFLSFDIPPKYCHLLQPKVNAYNNALTLSLHRSSPVILDLIGKTFVDST